VEVLLAGTVFALLVTALVGAYLYGEEATELSGNRARAVLLAEEGLEAARNIRDAAFSNLTDGTFGLSTTGNQWNLSGASDTSDIFTRQITISTIDSKRKSITSNVTWQQNVQRTGSVTLVSRLTNWLISNVGNWSVPAISANTDLTGNQNGFKIQVEGDYLYLIRSTNTANNFVVMNISAPDSPVLVSTANIIGTPTNLFVSGNFVYVTSADDTRELQIVDITTPSSPSNVGSYNAPGSGNANGVHVSGTTAYVVQTGSGSTEFSSINVASPASPVQLDTLELGATGNEVVVSGNHAFVASGSDSQEIQVVDITNPSVLSLAGSLNLPGTIDAETLTLAGTMLLVGQGTNFRTVSIASPTAPTLLGSLSVSGTINDIALAVAGKYVFIADQAGAQEFQVLDISTPSAPVLSAGIDITGGNPLFGVAYSSTYDRAYGAGQSDASEITIFAPQ